MKIYVNENEIILNKTHYVSGGGEGSIYAIKDTAFKIYNDPKRMIPISKIKELSVLKNDNIIKPNFVIEDSHKNIIGYTMKFLKNTEPLCKIFTKSFRLKNKITENMILNLVNKFRDMIEECHMSNILIVDLNEMNFLLNNLFTELFFIDVNSYQTPSFPATALMESVRDRHSNTYNENTDWFSFGIVSFQMFIGIHPYKGNHPEFQDKKTALDLRMKKNISVFNSNVSLPPIVYPFNVIPLNYLTWYKKIFENGDRIPPPFDDMKLKKSKILYTTIISNNILNIKFLYECSEEIIDYVYINNNHFITTSTKLYINNSIAVYNYPMIYNDNLIFYLKKIEHKLEIINYSTGQIYNINCDDYMIYNNRLIIKCNDTMNEISFIKINDNNIIIENKSVANILSQSTKIYNGLIIQNLLGTYFISIFPIKNIHYQFKIDELSGYRIIDAKYQNKVLILIAEKNNIYDKFIFRFSNNFQEYDFKQYNNIEYQDVNFICLDKGVCVDFVSDKLNLFFNIINNNSIKTIDALNIEGSKLYTDGLNVLITKDNKLYKINL